VIERGYADGTYEYTNGLYCPNWLPEAWLSPDDHVGQLWTPRFKALVPSLAPAALAGSMIMGCSPRYSRVTTRDHGRTASADGFLRVADAHHRFADA
jgi:hypothetical protein